MANVKPIDQRFPRSAQIRNSQEYAMVYANGVRVKGKSIRIIAAHAPDNTGPRIGLSVSRKFEKSAVKRNRVRRVLRSAFRLQRAKLPDFDLIIIPLLRQHDYSSPEVEKELINLCGKASRKLESR